MLRMKRVRLLVASAVLAIATLTGIVGPTGSVLGPDAAAAATWPPPYTSCSLISVGSVSNSASGWSLSRVETFQKVTNRYTVVTKETYEKSNRSKRYFYYKCGSSKFKRLQTVATVSERYRTCTATLLGNQIVSRRTCTGYKYIFGAPSPRITYGSWIKYG